MIRRGDARAAALVNEVVAALIGHGQLLCQPTIENEDGVHTLHVTFRPTSDHQALQLLELAAEGVTHAARPRPVRANALRR